MQKVCLLFLHPRPVLLAGMIFLFSVYTLLEPSPSWSLAATTAFRPTVLTPLSDIKQIALGGLHTCALTNSGGVKCWGHNDEGQLGDGTTTDRNTPIGVVGLSSGVKAIAAGERYSCALLDNGGIQCWGANNSGQLGDGSYSRHLTPVAVSGLTTKAIMLTAGWDFACLVTENGGAKCWGNNYDGQLGDGTNNNHPTPVDVTSLTSGVSSVAAGDRSTCAVTTSSSVKCWGLDTNQIAQNTPVDIVGLTSGVSAVTVNGLHTCALIGGGVKCWGANDAGQLGDGTTTKRASPGDVTGLTTGVSAVVAGMGHTCALIGGGVKCWGANDRGQLGNGANIQQTTPINVAGLTAGVVALAADGKHTCAVLSSAGVKCWGSNGYGEIGDGTGAGRNGLVTDVADLTSGVSALAAGISHTCALTSGGGVKCWGSNLHGELGDNSSLARQTPVEVAGLGSGVTAISASFYHTCALTSGGGVKCWGQNLSGELGDGTETDQLSPVNVVGLSSGVSAIAAGGGHTCALSSSGSVKCWGSNYSGELGDGTTVGHITPGDVANLSGNVLAIAAGGSHTCAVTTGGGLKCWGSNSDGQIGNGTTTLRKTPTNVIGLSSGVSAVALGFYHTCARLDSGGVKCWGGNATGQLGNGSTSGSTTPIDIGNVSTSISELTAGDLHTCALTTSSARCWGANDYGQVGNSLTSVYTLPVTVSALVSPIHRLIASQRHTCALTTGGGVQCWGDNQYGQLGNNTAWRTIPVDVLENSAAVTPTLTPTLTATATSTATLVATITPTSPSQPTATATPTSTPTAPPNPAGDDFENDDDCGQASPLTSDGTVQGHTFHTGADVDWAKFVTTAGITYRIDVQIPGASSADVVLELYAACDDGPTDRFDKTFSPGARLDVTAQADGIFYIKLINDAASGATAPQSYQLAVRPLENKRQGGALIIVAGRYKVNDLLQSNIHYVTDAVYALFQANGYTNNQIRYLATDPSRPGYSEPATAFNLQQAITGWATDKVNANRALTLYLMDHGDQDGFFLDGPNDEKVTPAQLNQWLNQLESVTPGVKVNVIVDACYSGSFIEGVQSISKAGRVIITSTNQQNVAYASDVGAYFSDYFLTALKQGYPLAGSFWEAQTAVRRTHTLQEPWLDGDGDGLPNELADTDVASQRSFLYAGTLGVADELWPPYIVQALPPPLLIQQSAVIQTEVRDDQQVRRVWAVLYPPSYQPPQNSLELVPEELPTIELQPQGQGHYAATYTAFQEVGRYRVIIHAEDNNGLTARPMVIEVNAGGRVFLPVVAR